MFWIPSQLEGAYVGQDVTIECHSEAFPDSINYWVKKDGVMLLLSKSTLSVLIVYSIIGTYILLFVLVYALYKIIMNVLILILMRLFKTRVFHIFDGLLSRLCGTFILVFVWRICRYRNQLKMLFTKVINKKGIGANIQQPKMIQFVKCQETCECKLIEFV